MRRKTKPYSTYLNLLSQFLCLSSQLSTNRMRFSFIESSALWSCLLHVTFQLGKFCIMSSACFVFFLFFFFVPTCKSERVSECFLRFVFQNILWKCEVYSKLSSVNASQRARKPKTKNLWKSVNCSLGKRSMTL